MCACVCVCGGGKESSRYPMEKFEEALMVTSAHCTLIHRVHGAEEGERVQAHTGVRAVRPATGQRGPEGESLGQPSHVAP